jgi:hypothetical protein
MMPVETELETSDLEGAGWHVCRRSSSVPLGKSNDWRSRMSNTLRSLALATMAGLVATVGSGCGADGPRREGETCAQAIECQTGLLCRPDSSGTMRCAQPLAECSLCASSQECTSGFACTAFSDGSQRCGSGVGETVCRVRGASGEATGRTVRTSR